jgi:hypothetical protein
VSPLSEPLPPETEVPDVFDVEVTPRFDALSVAGHVIARANNQIRSRVRTVTCLIHGRTFPVRVHDLQIGVEGETCCKDGIDQAIERAVEDALR